MTLRDVLNEAAMKMKDAGIRDAALDARILMEAVWRMDTAQLLTELDRPLCSGIDGGDEPEICPGDCSFLPLYRDMTDRRAARIPLQHILGGTGFMGLYFLVNENVLIPRQDTEVLAETVIRCEKNRGIRLLDLCTGSGCLAVSLKKLIGCEQVTGTDISEKALDVARKNADNYSLDIRFLQGDLFNALPAGERFDVIVSNPPYIRTEELKTLEPEVREHDPREALDGGRDGLTFYRRIAAEAPSFLTDGGRLYLEIGFDQAEEVKNLLLEAGFSEIHLVKDLGEKDRVMYAKYRG